jgi:xanthine dehydrogenase accessory factor
MSDYEKGTWRENLRYKYRLRIYREDLVFGPGVAELMERVDQTGTLSGACRQMGMAYSKAWKIVKRAENDLGFPLMEGSRGGAKGGNMCLTEEGRRFIQRYQAMNADLRKSADTLFQKYFLSDSCSEIGESLVIVRGGGDLATGTIHRLHSAGYPVLVLEAEHPAAIRRQVAISEAVYEGHATVEGMEALLIQNMEEIPAVIAAGKVPVLVDPEGKSIETLKPYVVVDAILAKKNLGTRRDMAPFTIALGPGFTAGEDVDVVIETKRGHNLGRVIRCGSAFPNSGIPGNIGGYTSERVIHAEAEGILRNVRSIGDIVEKGETIARIEMAEGELLVPASITGIIRGLIRDGYPVTKGFKIADIDPRKEELKNCFTISDKARCIAGSVLEQVCAAFAQKERMPCSR